MSRDVGQAWQDFCLFLDRIYLGGKLQSIEKQVARSSTKVLCFYGETEKMFSAIVRRFALIAKGNRVDRDEYRERCARIVAVCESSGLTDWLKLHYRAHEIFLIVEKLESIIIGATTSNTRVNGVAMPFDVSLEKVLEGVWIKFHQ